MLSYTDLKPGTNFIKDGEPYVVFNYVHVKKQRGAPVVQLSIKSLISGKNKEITVHQKEKFEEAEIEEVSVEFLYYQERKGEFWFKNPDNPSERFFLLEDKIGDYKKYLKPGLILKILKFNKEYINLKVPAKVDLKVVEAPPAVKGNTAEGGTKQVVLETGHKINTPLFIEKGDVIRVNTETGEYTERV
jgi:elongation factor P